VVSPGLVIVAGDLNTTPFEPGFAVIADGLTDAHATVGTGPGFTWRPAFLEPLDAGVIRIDHVLTGSRLLPVAVDEECGLPGDHCRLTVLLELGPDSSVP